MDPSSTALSFAEGRALVPFWVALSSGLMLAGIVVLARPWPPRRARWAGIGACLLAWMLAMGYLLLERRVLIDPEAQEVREGHRVLGLGPERRWPFAGVAAVVLARTDHGQLLLSLEVSGGELLAIRAYADVLQAEQEALALAGFGGWKALRRGYRLRHDPVGRPQTFRTAQGKQGVVFAFNELVQIVDRPGDEAIAALP